MIFGIRIPVSQSRNSSLVIFVLTTHFLISLEFEIRLTQLSTKFRVVPSLAGGAHLLFPNGSTTLAVRIYTHQCLAKLDSSNETLRVRELYRNNTADLRKRKSQDETLFYNLDNIRSFRDAYKHSLVMFVLPSSFLQLQMSQIDSAFHLLQAALVHDKEDNKGCAKVCICQDHCSAIDSIISTLDSLSPEKVEKKSQFFQNVSRSLLFPLKGHNSNIHDCLVAKENSHFSKNIATSAMKEWGDSCGISGDLSVVMNVMGSLETIMNADEHYMDLLPISNQSKLSIISFFKKASSAIDQNKTGRDEHMNIFASENHSVEGRLVFNHLDQKSNRTHFNPTYQPNEPRPSMPLHPVSHFTNTEHGRDIFCKPYVSPSDLTYQGRPSFGHSKHSLSDVRYSTPFERIRHHADGPIFPHSHHIQSTEKHADYDSNMFDRYMYE